MPIHKAETVEQDGDATSLDTPLLHRESFGPENLIPDSEVSFSFVRSGGPGGQNVNKVNTKAVLRFDIAKSKVLSPRQKEQVLARSTKARDGIIVVWCSEERSQFQNRVRALQILNRHLEDVLKPEVPRKLPEISEDLKEHRLHQKRRKSEKKRARSRRHDRDESE